MNIYSRKQLIKRILLAIAIIIGLASFGYTFYLVKKLSTEERRKIELWAEATREIQDVDLDGEISLITYKILQENNTIPVILVDEGKRIISSSNLDSAKSLNQNYLHKQLELMKSQHEPISINYAEGQVNYIYYKDSFLLTQLIYYPIVQLTVVLLFVLVSYLAFKNSQKAEENQLWVGMSKETAHQIGTPLSSLLAWVEMMKLKNEDSNLVMEVEKDVKRLETITDRFSKIGSSPVLEPTNIISVLIHSIAYLKNRTSSKITYIQNFSDNRILIAPINISLIEWVVENICKNAIDAMSGVGTITISLDELDKEVIIDIKDTGKGISSSKLKTIFKPGYTTKKRGWGLGLSLAKRIIETYHQGRIFVKQSELNKGTTFRIILNK